MTKIPDKPNIQGKQMTRALASLQVNLVRYGFHGSAISHDALTMLKMNCKPLTPELQQELGGKSKKVVTGHLLTEAFSDLLANYVEGRGLYSLKSPEALAAWLQGLNIQVATDAIKWLPGIEIGSSDKTVYMPAELPEHIRQAIAELPGMVRPLTDEARQSLGLRFNSVSAKELLSEAIFWLTVKYAIGKGKFEVRNAESLKAQLLTLGFFEDGLLNKVK